MVIRLSVWIADKAVSNHNKIALKTDQKSVDWQESKNVLNYDI